MHTFSELAGEAYGMFERRTREDGDAYYTLRDGAPEWLHDLVHEAHGDMLPDDWRYDAIHSALGAIHDSGADTPDDCDDLEHEFADGEVDAYNGARVAWLGSHLQRGGYCDEAQEELGASGGVYDLIGAGQYMEAREVFASVLDSLRERFEELEAEAEEVEA